MQNPNEPYTADDIRDLISEAISDSIDMDWQPGWGADAVVKALADAGLIVVPDLKKVCADHDLTYAGFNLHSAGSKENAFYSVDGHRGQLAKSANGPTIEAALGKMLEADFLDTAPLSAERERIEAAGRAALAEAA